MTELLEFGIKRENEIQRDGGCAVVFDPETQMYAVTEDTEGGKFRLCSGGVDADEDIQTGVLREVTEESGLYDFQYVEKIEQVVCHFYNSLKKLNRIANTTCFLVILKSRDLKPVYLEEHEKFKLAWVTADELLANWEARNKEKDNDHWIYFLNKCVPRIQELGYKKVSYN